MTPAEEGAFIRLLCHAWQSDDCGLPDDDSALAELSRLRSQWTKSGAKIRRKFEAVGGRLFNTRLVEERQKQIEWRNKSAAGGRKAAHPKSNDSNKEGQGWLANGCHLVPTIDQPTPQPNANISSSSSSLSTNTSSAADAADLLPFPAPISEETLIAETAARICARHPRQRTCGPAEAGKQLKAIVGKLPKSERPAKLERIDANHQGWCECDQWTKDGGEYAKGLDNWLAPTKGRYDLLPPPRAAPESSRRHRSSVMECVPIEGTKDEKIEALRWLIDNPAVPEDAILHRQQLAELEGKHAD